MKINVNLMYDGKTKDVTNIIDRLLLECCDIYFYYDENIGDDEICENCETYSDECKTYKIDVKYKNKLMFSFYICMICAEKNNLLKE